MELAIYIIILYFILVFVLSRFFIPHLSFKIFWIITNYKSFTNFTNRINKIIFHF